MAKGIDITKVGTVDQNTVYIEIHEDELEGFPELRNALSRCREFNECWHSIQPDEWYRIKDFLERKKHERGYLFTIASQIETELPHTPQNLDKSPLQLKNIPIKLISIFESNNVSLSELTYIQYDDYNQNWQIFERKYTPEKKIYEIWKEDGNLNVYDAGSIYYEIFKVGDEYYTFSLWLA